MVLCPTGTSVQPGAPGWFTFDQDYVTLALPSQIASWVTPWLLGLPSGPVETATFCATEPTGDLPTTADYAKLAVPLIALVSGTYTRIGNQVRRDKFHDLCQCNSTAGGTCHVGWSPSATTTNRASTGGTAFEFGTKFTVSAACTIYGVDTWFPDPPQSTVVIATVWDEFSGSNIGSQAFTYVGGYERYLFTTPISLVSGRTYQVSACSAAGTFHSDMSTSPTSDSLLTFVDKQYAFVCGSHPVTSAGGWPPIAPIVCTGGAPGLPAAPAPSPPAIVLPTGAIANPGVAPTCASYQDICNYLAVIDREIQMIANLQQIVKDETVPFEMVEGTVHSGLTGAGQFPVSGILGLRATLTTVPSYIGSDPGDPTALFRAGWVNWGSAEGWLGGAPLRHTDEAWLAIQPSVNLIGYTLPSGVVLTITELNR